MMIADLNVVRALNQKVAEQKARIENLRLTAEDLVPAPNNLPHSTEVKSRVEKLALTLVEEGEKLSALQLRLTIAKLKLTDDIVKTIDDVLVQRVALLRYVDCLSYKEIARRLHCSLRHTFRLHQKIFKYVIG